MKHFLYIFILLIFPIKEFKKASVSEPLSGVDPYRVLPQDISKEVAVTIPYFTSETTTLVYRYEVYSPSGSHVFSQSAKSTSLLANSRFLITYTAPRGATGEGHNRLFFYFQASHHQSELVHYISFYGYKPGVSINLNKGEEAADKLKKEVVFEYLGYKKRSVIYHETTLYPMSLTGYVYTPTDLYIDPQKVEMRMKSSYEEPPLQEGILYCEDHTIFPLMTTINPGEVGFRIGLKKDGNQLTIFLIKPLYVDEMTLLIVDEPRFGFKPTQKIYFPVTRMGSINMVPFRLELHGFGYHQFNVSYRFKLEVGTSFLSEGGLFEPMIDRY